MYETRVLSGMRPTGSLHLGHYHGVLKNWVRLQAEYPCLFFVADWHALTTDYEKPGDVQQTGLDMVIDWLAAGVDPNQAILFVQSQVLEHAELHLLLSMMTPLGWLERVPTYKDQQEKLADKDLSTYGFLGYPLLQSADILIYRARYVPVGEDQVPHIEFTREVGRRFNHLYGREAGFEEKAKGAVKKMGTKKARLLNDLRTKFLEQGDAASLARAQALLDEVASTSRSSPPPDGRGLAEMLQRVPFQRSTTGRRMGRVPVSARPTAQALVGESASTPHRTLSNWVRLGLDTAVQVAAAAGPASGSRATTSRADHRTRRVRDRRRGLWCVRMARS